MGLRTTDKTAAANRVLTTVTMDVSNTSIVAASLIDIGNAGQPNDCWAELGIMAGGTDQAKRVALLQRGYTGPGSIVGWTGHIHLGAESYVYANIYSSSANNYRLAVITGKTQTPANSAGGTNG